MRFGYGVYLKSNRNPKPMRQAVYWDKERAQQHAGNLRHSYANQPDVKVSVRKVGIV